MNLEESAEPQAGDAEIVMTVGNLESIDFDAALAGVDKE